MKHLKQMTSILCRRRLFPQKMFNESWKIWTSLKNHEHHIKKSYILCRRRFFPMKNWKIMKIWDFLKKHEKSYKRAPLYSAAGAFFTKTYKNNNENMWISINRKTWQIIQTRSSILCRRRLFPQTMFKQSWNIWEILKN